MNFIYLLLAILTSTLAIVNSEYFLQISDIHYDSLYSEGAPNNCLFGDLSIGCCRNTSVPIKPYDPAGKYGDHNCDSPLSLVEGILEYISTLDIKFILWLGDNTNHGDFRQSLEKNINATKFLTSMFKKYFPNKRIYPSLGNHDTFPVDQINAKYYRLFESLYSSWCDLISNDTRDCRHLLKGGYYSVKMTDFHRIVSLNTAFYDPHNLLVNENEDPAEQFEWLLNILTESRLQNETVWIIGHHPPLSMKNSFGKILNDIVVDFSDIITASFWGHTHSDQFFLYSKNFSKDIYTNVGYVVSSVVPMERNPTFRVYEYEKEKEKEGGNRMENEHLNILNYDQYIFDINNAKTQIYYNAKNIYSMKDMSLDSWINLKDRIKTQNETAQLYHQHYLTNFNVGMCNQNCIKEHICSIICTNGKDYDICNNS